MQGTRETYYTLEFTNVSRRACSLVCSVKGRASLSVQAIQAWPGVPGYAMIP